MPLKVAGVEIVNSTANLQVSTLPDTGIVTQEFGNTTFSITANVTNRGIVNSISIAEINKTSRNFGADSNNDSSYVVYVSTSSPSGGANGDIWYQTFN
jgi:hypothetical protein